MATVHPPPPPFALLPRPRVDMEGDSDTESVAESCSCPFPRRTAAAADDSSSSSCGCCHDEEEEGMDDDDEDEDGCSSCVEGDECSSYQQHLHEAAADYGESNKAGSGVWWEQMAVAGAGGGTFPLPTAARAQEEAAEDPKLAAERQAEEGRKFWEDCLASGYP